MRVDSGHRPDQLALLAAGFVALFGWLWAYAPLHGAYLAESDIYEQFLPTFLSPLTFWSPFEFGGAPAFADPAEAIWYPLHLFFTHVVPSFTAYVVSANLVAALGAYAYVFSLTRSKTAALFSGLAYGLSEAMMERASHLATMQTAAWLPLVALTVDRLRGPQPWRWMALGALIIANALLAGNPQTFLYGAYFCAIYGIVGGIAEHARPRYYVAAVGAVALGGLLAAVMVLPVLETSLHTARQYINFEQFVRGGLNLPKLLSGVFPTILHDGRGSPTYVGLLTLLFATVSLRGLFSNWRVGFWVCAAIAAALISVDSSTTVTRLAFEIPFYDRFRIASRHLHIVSFGITVLAGIAIAGIRRQEIRGGSVATGAGVLLLAMAAAAWTIARQPEIFAYDDRITLPFTLPVWNMAIWVQIGIGLVTVALALAFATRPRSRLVVAMVVTLLVGDLVYALPYDVTPFGLETVVLAKDAALRPSVHAERLAAVTAPGHQRILSPSGTQLDAVVPAAFARFWRIPIAGGYGPMLLESYGRTAEMGTNGSVERQVFAAQDAALDLLAVRYLTVHEEDLTPSDTFEQGGLDWATTPLNFAVGPPECQVQRPLSVSLALPSDVATRAVALVAHLACAGGVPQDTAVATVRVTDGEGRLVEEKILRAGVEIADQSLANPDLLQRASHAPAVIFDTGASDYSYLTTIALPAPTRGAVVHLTLSALYGSLVIDHVTAIDAQGRSLPQTLSGLLLRDRDRWRETERFTTSRSTDRGRDEQVAGEEPYVVFENRRALPLAWIAHETAQLSDRDLDTAIHYSTLPDGRRFEPEQTALLGPDGPPATIYPAGPSSVSIRSVADGRVVVDVTSEGGGFLVLSETIYPGWHAHIDDSVTPVQRTNGTIQGVTIPPGSHVVVFEILSDSLRRGAIVSGSALLVVLGLLWWTRPRRGEAAGRVSPANQ